MVPTVDDLQKGLKEYFARTTVALAISDAKDDVPLALVNRSFCDLTGYAEAEAVGRNCRFLQGAETGEESRRAMHDFVHDDSVDGGRFPVINYRKDGTRFHNLVFMTRLRDSQGTTRFFLASQFDMTSAQKRAELRENDRKLKRSLADIDTISREFSVAMEGSAKILSDSIAMMARLVLDASR